MLIALCCCSGHSIGFAQQLTAVLTSHCDVVQQHKIHCYLNSVKLWLPRIEAFCDIKNAAAAATAATATMLPDSASAAGGTGGTGGHKTEEERRRSSSGGSTLAHGRGSATTGRPSMGGGGFDSSSHNNANNSNSANNQDRNILRRHTQLVKQIMSLLQRNAVIVFGECVKEMKPVIEICEITSGNTEDVAL